MGKDHTTVTTGTHQCTLGGSFHDLPGMVGIQQDDIRPCRLHRQQHIGTRIAIRNGEYVQRVDDILIGLQPEHSGFKHGFPLFSVESLRCILNF